MIIIAVPIFGQGYERFHTCLQEMVFHSLKEGIDIEVVKRKGCYVEHARNLLVRDALRKKDVSHILWLDADMAFSPDLLVTLLKHDKDIVCGNYYRKQEPYDSVVGVLGEKDLMFPCNIAPGKEGLRPVSAAGTGICLTKIDVFRKVPFPWFENCYSLPPDGAEIAEDLLIEGHILLGEDFSFFLKAQGSGVTVHCDFNLNIGHIGEYVYTYKDNEREQTNN